MKLPQYLQCCSFSFKRQCRSLRTCSSAINWRPFRTKIVINCVKSAVERAISLSLSDTPPSLCRLLEMYWFLLVGLCRQNTKRAKGKNTIYWNSTSTASSFPFYSCHYFIHCFIGSRIFSHSSWNLAMKCCTVNSLTRRELRLSQPWWKGWYQNLNNLPKPWVC